MNGTETTKARKILKRKTRYIMIGGFLGAGLAWDEPAKDVGLVVDWIRKNIAMYKGNPNRIFLWADSAGNGPVSTYAAHPEISGANGAAVKGVILMSSPNFNIMPVTVPALIGARWEEFHARPSRAAFATTI